MKGQRTIFEPEFLRRVVALMAGAALLFFAGGATLHQHRGGPDNACHICQALHMPALATARLSLSSSPVIIAWLSSAPKQTVQSDTFALHRASRAPPAA
ncbi:MAG TPA: hypothetical protein VKB66_06465 [Candidatus Acidoferrum sp.]|nr:hypothetical protein [Candidatus Acidoferrum sp.]